MTFDPGLWLMRYTMLPGQPQQLAVIKNTSDDGRTAREIMEDLRKESPDEHALLSEHIVLPEE